MRSTANSGQQLCTRVCRFHTEKDRDAWPAAAALNDCFTLHNLRLLSGRRLLDMKCAFAFAQLFLVKFERRTSSVRSYRPQWHSARSRSRSCVARWRDAPNISRKRRVPERPCVDLDSSHDLGAQLSRFACSLRGPLVRSSEPARRCSYGSAAWKVAPLSNPG